MKITERDKKLLIVLLMLVILAVPILFVVNPLQNKNAVLDQEISSLQSRYDYLVSLESQQEYFQNETVYYNQENASVLQSFPADIAQEASILFLNRAESLIPVSLYQTNFSATDVYLVDASATEHNEGSLIAKSTVTRFSYETSYEGYKKLVEYLNTNLERMVVTAINANYAKSADVVSGEFSLTQYAVSGPGREMGEISTYGIGLGTNNIFDEAAIGELLEGESQTREYQGFIRLGQSQAEGDSHGIGLTQDADRKSVV